ncbi:signal peptidase I [Gemmatimonas sp.]|uniref:signal peptidase I n=1 Tax=Gemmatimonas sp. TaxID=1962908 RepID=UPI003564D032
MALEKYHRANALRAANGRSRRRAYSFGWLWDWAKVLPPTVLLFLILRTFVVEAYKIPSGSMERTLLVGDFLLVNKWLYGAEVPYSRRRLPAVRAPQLGDILVFEWPADPTKSFVKRLVGRPGDTLSMQGGSLLRNGVLLREQYVSHAEPNVDPVTDEFRWQRGYLTNTAAAANVTTTTNTNTNAGMPPIYRPSRDNWGPIVVPPKHLFVLGDNRDNSLDSRYWGFVPDSLLRGTPWIVYYSFTPDSTSRASWLTRIRWGRLGSVVR